MSVLRWVLVLLVLVGVEGLDFNDSIVGWYEGSPSVTVMGPMKTGMLRWSITRVDEVNFVFENHIGGFIQGSHQQFMVAGEKEKQLTYCGILRNYFPLSTDIVQQYVYRSDLSTSSTAVWCAHFEGGGCDTFKWVMTVVSEGVLRMQVYLPPPVVHADVVLTRKGTDPTKGYPAPLKDREHCREIVGRTEGYYWHQPAMKGWHIDPYAPPPQTVPDLVRKRGVSDTVSFCLRLNNDTEFTMSWLKRRDSQVANITLSAATSGYIALGFGNDFPAMAGGRIVLGSRGCGVKQYVANRFVGAPDKQQWTPNMTDTAVKYVGGKTAVSFSLTLPENPTSTLMFAVGEMSPDCEPSYHNTLRGTFPLMSWNDPSRNLPLWITC